MTRIWASLPWRPLPRPTVPMLNECIDSYLARLAAANRLDADALRTDITGDHRKSAPVPAEVLAALSGQPERSLRYAIPELRAGDKTIGMHLAGRPSARDPERSSCTLCAAARGHTGHPPSCHSHPEDAVCPKHQRWLGNSIDPSGEQLDLTGQPVIVNANHTHRRLARLRGRAATDEAYRFAHDVCHGWRNRLERQEQFMDLIGALRPGRRQLAAADPAVHAARYPQIVAITQLLVSPHWHRQAHAQWDRPEQLLRDLRRAAAPNPYWGRKRSRRTDKPLIAILLDDRRQPERMT